MKQILFCLLLVVGLGLGCSGEPAGPELGIEFSWPRGMKTCFDTQSPEIRLEGVPEGTQTFSVAVYDTEYSVNHGGGKVENDGTGIIALGAVPDYRGPCSDLALSGPGKYQFTVKALGGDNQVLASGKKTRSYPEE